MTLPPPPERPHPSSLNFELPAAEPHTTEPAYTERPDAEQSYAEQAHTEPPHSELQEQPLPEPATKHESVQVPHTRIGAAWAGVWAGIVVVILLIIFIGQNTAKVQINFLWLHGMIPTALALLIAGVGGAVIVTAVGAARIVQLRRLVRRRG